MTYPLTGPITQIGYLTDDIEATAKAWSAATGVGPWTRMRSVTLASTMDGKPTEFQIDVALSYRGDQQIELIKPLCDNPSPYLANKTAGLWGVHHLQFTTDDMDAALAQAKRAGLELACRIDSGGGIYTYLRGPGIWFELMQSSPGLDGLFGFIKSTTVDWDGNDLIRDFGL